VRKNDVAGQTVYHYDLAGRIIGESTPTAQKIRDYLYVAGRLVMLDGCVTNAPPNCTQREWYHPDLLGSMLTRTDSSGAVTARLEYLPWGEVYSSLGTSIDRQYNGRVFDSGTGFHDYGARMYSPQAGRFISADPAGTHFENPQSLNRYAYVWNNPYKFNDPDGKDVTIVIKRDTYTTESVTGTISVTSDVAGAGSFDGYTLETTTAGKLGDKNPISPGLMLEKCAYAKMVRRIGSN
jgi:RHS repeat-associated protein